MLSPLLQFVKDGQEHRIRDAYGGVADILGLTDEERKKLLPSGKVPVINNRVQWAKVDLLKAALLESPQRGIIKITDRGREVLSSGKHSLTEDDLMQFPEYVEFIKYCHRNRTPQVAQTPQEDQDQTPDELIEAAYEELRSTLAEEVLSQVKAASPGFFEKLVVDLLVAMGYGGSIEDAGQVVGGSGDQGIDGIIKEDRLGLDVIYLQAKRWEGSVSRPEIQKFAGALQGQRAKKGIFVTTSSFTKEAENYAKDIDSAVVLIDGPRLSELMIDFGIGVSVAKQFVTKRVDSDYFEEE